MAEKKRIALDANILIRAVLGRRVSGLLHAYQGCVEFFTTQSCMNEAHTHLPIILEKRSGDSQNALALIDGLSRIVYAVDPPFYEHRYQEAFQRIGARDPNDWPLVALALQLGCPVWTEDKDFFGSGIATWTTETIAHYLDDM